MKCFICTLGFVSFNSYCKNSFTFKYDLSSDDPKRKVEFIVRDIEDNTLENAKITIKKGDTVLEENKMTNADGKYKMSADVNLGDELTIDFVLDPDHAKTTTTFKVGEPEDNTQDKDDLASKTFTKYLLLKKSSVRF